MRRLIDKQLNEWKTSTHRKPILLRGARQVGKTHSIRELGKSFNDFIEINFEKSPELTSLFDLNLNPDRIIKDLIAILKRPIIPGKTLLFFDEIQTAPKAITALRYFYEEKPELHVIAAGSLLDFAIEQVGIPVGRVSYLYMYPLSFIEFLYALERDLLIEQLLSHTAENPLSDILHQTCLRLLGEYLAIGGMPEAVNVWITTQNIVECTKIHQTLIDTYRQDFEKYAKKHQIKYLNLLFDHIPKRVGKKFKFSAISTDYQKRELSPALDLLIKAGLVNKIIWSAGNGIPLGAESDSDDFKPLFLDIALTQAILGLDLGPWIVNPFEQFINKVELVEAFVGQELLTYADPHKKTNLYYWHRQARGSEAEIDYLLQKQENVIPIEVKSGSGSTLKSMHMFLESHQEKSPYGIRFSTLNYSVFNTIHSYPLYAIAKIMNIGSLKQSE